MSQEQSSLSPVYRRLLARARGKAVIVRGFLLDVHAMVAGRTAGGRSSLASEFFHPMLKLPLASK